jgi:LuxR family maltose regulon positive regulatory protein
LGIIEGGAPRNIPQQHTLLLRPRINDILLQASQESLVTISANSGYGKTCAVHQFIVNSPNKALWFALSDRDNNPMRFWETLIRSSAKLDPYFSKSVAEIGFPESDLQYEQYLDVLHDVIQTDTFFIVYDNAHLITNEKILKLISHSAEEGPANITRIIISQPGSRMASEFRFLKSSTETITEAELSFTEQEVADYLEFIGAPSSRKTSATIYQETEGWAFAVNLAGKLLKKTMLRQSARSDTEAMVARNAFRANIQMFIERQFSAEVDSDLLKLLVRMSLLDYLPDGLVRELAKDERLQKELDTKVSFVRHDTMLCTYSLHQLLREWLRTKQCELTEDEVLETWREAARWYEAIDYKTDAVSFYEAAGDWRDIIRIGHLLPQEIPQSTAQFFYDTLSRGPAETLQQVPEYFVLRVRLLICLRRFEEAIAEATAVIEEYSGKPQGPFNTFVLGSEYVGLGLAQMLIAPVTDKYDFDKSMEQAYLCDKSIPWLEKGDHTVLHIGASALLVGTERKGAMEEYLDALKRAVFYLEKTVNGCGAGMYDLALAEYMYFRGESKNGDIHAVKAYRDAGQGGQVIIQYHALLFRIMNAIADGDFDRLQSVKSDADNLYQTSPGLYRSINYDVVCGFYYAALGEMDKVATWLRTDFELGTDQPSRFTEDYMHITKLRILLEDKRYRDILSYIEADNSLHEYLIGRLTLKSIEAVCLYNVKRKKESYEALREAYKMAQPNHFDMVFIRLGAEMRTLIAAAMKEPGGGVKGIPKSWLQTIHRRSSVYAKRKKFLCAAHRQEEDAVEAMEITKREKMILTDLSRGLSRAEIAEEQGISVNTVKTVLNTIYAKFGAQNNVDAIRIANERRLL